MLVPKIAWFVLVLPILLASGFLMIPQFRRLVVATSLKQKKMNCNLRDATHANPKGLGNAWGYVGLLSNM